MLARNYRAILGNKIQVSKEFPVGCEVVVSVAGLDPCPGIVRWSCDGAYGITFNRVIPLATLVSWLREQRGGIRAAG